MFIFSMPIALVFAEQMRYSLQQVTRESKICHRNNSLCKVICFHFLEKHMDKQTQENYQVC